MKIDVAIIGGTGIGDRLAALGGTPLHIPTPAGVLRGKQFDANGASCLLLSRHSAGHKVPPHKVNYAAMALGLKAIGVKACLATAAVGSLRRDWTAGTLVACSDFLDLTYRNLTLFDRSVTHRDFTHPYSEKCRTALQAAGEHEGLEIQPGGVYVCLNGPRYETPHEIKVYEQLKGDLVGMTAASEATLMREAEVDYGCLAIVTNLAAGISPTLLSHQEVVECMEKSGEYAVKILLEAARRIAAH